MSPKVSVILPVYNVERFLAKCLDSLINQTLADIEIICVDDCSGDDSLEIVKAYAARDSRLKIITHQENRKLAGARNSGLLVAEGEYVSFVDSDDYVAEDFLEKLYGLAMRENADIAKGAHKLVSGGVLKDEIISNNPRIQKNKFNFRFTLWTAIFKREMLCRHDIKFMVDTIVFQVKAVYFSNKVAVTDEAIYYYVRRDDSNDSPVFSLKKWQELNIRGAELVLDFINSVPVLKEDYQLLVNDLVLRLPLYGYERLAKSDISKGFEILQDVLRRFRGNVRYKDESRRAFAHASDRGRKYAKLHVPGIFRLLFNPKKRSEILQIREIARRSAKIAKTGHFAVAEYPIAVSTNIGDCIQQVAITGALEELFPNTPIHFVARDSWCEYQAGGLSIMQGWFGYRKSFPSKDTIPLWIGTHFTDGMQAFVQQAASANHALFGAGGGFGARDRKTLNFMRTIDSMAYLSRCYSLTLPRRVAEPGNGKVFLVNIPQEWEQCIPSGLLNGAIRITHGVRDVFNAADRMEFAQNLLKRYADEARLIITCKVHAASPCTAMGIPVVVITESSESKERLSFLDDFVAINTQEDLQRGLIDWTPQVPDIENLKQLMLENLRFSIAASQGCAVDSVLLDSIREKIANFRK